ncbi:hypothetical protein Y032_0016g3002 [Ancylostoma ceylanicum]|uniref:Uncharacterized protein n=1 Tax=Ancylostoma ceylanicum TaxID=53326 RepID=A0A016V772_9BILA|nr:hypothetical protein Y032_0016g3002 [Ancylostoma ceylanicum]
MSHFCARLSVLGGFCLQTNGAMRRFKPHTTQVVHSARLVRRAKYVPRQPGGTLDRVAWIALGKCVDACANDG